jgi:hypothetical protein
LRPLHNPQRDWPALKFLLLLVKALFTSSSVPIVGLKVRKPYRAMDEFQAATDAFLAWFKSVGGEFRDDLLEIKDLRAKDAGRGISKLQYLENM